MQTSQKKFIAPHPGITLCVLFSLILLTSLSGWQFQRGKMKQNILDEFESNSQHALLNDSDLAEITANPTQYNHRILQVEGEFINQKHILLDNQVLNGRVGYLVFTPLKTNNNYTLLVNRGWIPLEESRNILPTIEPIHQIIKIKGQLESPTKNRFIKQSNNIGSNNFPLIVQQIDIKQLEPYLKLKILGNILNLDKNSLFGFETPHPKSQWLNPQKHYAYSLQWFLLAISLLTIYILANRHSKRIK